MKKIALSLGANPEFTSVISMGVDTAREFTPDPTISRDKGNLLFVGRLVERKGLALLIAAMPDILAKFPNCTLTIVGDGPAREDLRRLSLEAGVDGQVVFIGAVANDQLPGFYRKASVFICPSVEQEGFGLVCVEALACECPVVATDLPALREIIQDGTTGLLFQCGNRFELCQQVLTLLQNPEIGRDMGIAGRKFVQLSLDREVVAHDYCNVFERATGHKQ